MNEFYLRDAITEIMLENGYLAEEQLEEFWEDITYRVMQREDTIGEQE